MESKKYVMCTDRMLHLSDGRVVYQIQALKDFGSVRRGMLGGYIESEQNLSQSGNCWIFDKAIVTGKAIVSDNACIFGDVQIFGNAMVYGNAGIAGNVMIFGNAKVLDNAKVYGNAQISDKAFVCGNSEIYGNAKISQHAFLTGNARVAGSVGGIKKIDSDMSHLANLLLYENMFDAWDYIVKENVYIDQDTYLPTIFKYYNPTKKSINEKYDVGIETNKEEIHNLLNYVWGLKYIDGDVEKQRYITNLNANVQWTAGDRWWEQYNKKYSSISGIAVYLRDLCTIFSDKLNRKVVLLPIPSSSGKDNIVTIVSHILGNDSNYPYFIDGSDILRRTKSEEPVHSQNGVENRDWRKRIKSLIINRKINEYRDAIFLVLDDVTTTGGSLEAVDHYISYYNINPQQIINFVYAKSRPWYEFIEMPDDKYYVKETQSDMEENQSLNLDTCNIIWDLDNTLMPKDVMNPQFYQGLENVLGSNNHNQIIVTNRSKKKITENEYRILEMYDFKEKNDADDVENRKRYIIHGKTNMYRLRTENDGTKPIFYSKYVFADSDDVVKRIYFLKPSCEPIRNALAILAGSKKFKDIDNIARVTIGVGNNESDIIAYKKAGVYAVLVNWGNKVKIKNSMADRVFDNVDEFVRWINGGQSSYLEIF